MLADHTEAIRLDPTNAVALSNRGVTWNIKKDYDKAIADFSEAIHINPKLSIAYFNRGISWRAKKENEKAVVDYSEAIMIDTTSFQAYLNRAKVRQDLGQYGKALADWTDVIRCIPRQAMGYNGQAWLLATCPDAQYRDGPKAVKLATRACEISRWKSAEDLDTLAAAFAETGDYNMAVRWQREVIDLLFKDSPATEECRLRLILYLSGKPYRHVR